MKQIFSISLNILLLLVFTATPTSYISACGKSKCKKEVVQHTASHQKSTCQKGCCKKTDSHPKKNKCCGDNCRCSVSITASADMPKQLPIILSIKSVPIYSHTFFYKQVILQSTIQDIWQPPISVSSIG
jgi:hypothetical protein